MEERGAPTDRDEIVARVAAGTGLTAAEAARVVDDVIAFHAETLHEYVRRRHREMRLVGLHNDEIFTRVRAELRDRPVAPPPVSERQLRRIVYG